MPSSKQTQPFGVGCFHFGFFPEAGSSRTGKDYVAKLRDALEAITNINSVEIDAADDFLDIDLGRDFEGEALKSSQSFFPCEQCQIEIKFTIVIPKRVQDALFQDCGIPHSLDSERFSVHISYGFYFPFTVVLVNDPAADCEPSDGVILIREFLEREFKKLHPEAIRFECLGPSPFHADFFLEEEADDCAPTGTICEREERRGYDCIRFKWHVGILRNRSEAFESLHTHIETQLQFFYQLNHLSLQRALGWSEFSDSLRSLTDKHRAAGVRAVWFNTFRAGPEIHDAMITLAEFEGADLQNLHETKRQLISLTSAELFEAELQRYVQKEFDEFDKFPVEQAGRILTLLESRRSKRLNIVVTLLAAIVGGAVGALLTLAAT
jgi:hypothetical protein